MQGKAQPLVGPVLGCDDRARLTRHGRDSALLEGGDTTLTAALENARGGDTITAGARRALALPTCRAELHLSLLSRPEEGPVLLITYLDLMLRVTTYFSLHLQLMRLLMAVLIFTACKTDSPRPSKRTDISK